MNATAELAAPASSIGLNVRNLLIGYGTALSLPMKFRLENPLLGNDCYIGSDADPITLNLTSGTTSPDAPNEPITGSLGTVAYNAEGFILRISNSTLVDNTFSAPPATGCGGVFASLIDPLINARWGLPAASGENTAIFTGTHEQTDASLVQEASESATAPPESPRTHPWPPHSPWPWRR